MAKVDTQKQVKELLKRAEDSVRAVFESDKYRKYLSTLAKFHDYSSRNVMLITLQKPEASCVAGYVAWQKKFNRQVQRGEKGIAIVGYAPKNIKQEQNKTDARGSVVLGADGRPEKETVTVVIPDYTTVYVYDISQTEGEPLPTVINELSGSVDAYKDLITALNDVAPCPIKYKEINDGANGYYYPTEQNIIIRQGMSEAQTVKTTIHEITHADLHTLDADNLSGEKKNRRTREVEAESVAYVVCNHFGIDTSEYSFGYLAFWSASKELSELQNSLDTIQKQANELINRIDKRLTELQKDRSIEVPESATHRVCHSNKAVISNDEVDHYADSIIHDNDIDMDREKTRKQLGFLDNPEKNIMTERFAAAKAESARRNIEKAQQALKLQIRKER